MQDSKADGPGPAPYFPRRRMGEFSVSKSDKSIPTAGGASIQSTPSYQSGTSEDSIPDYTLYSMTAPSNFTVALLAEVKRNDLFDNGICQMIGYQMVSKVGAVTRDNLRLCPPLGIVLCDQSAAKWLEFLT